MKISAQAKFLSLLVLLLSSFYFLASIFPTHAQQSSTNPPNYSTPQNSQQVQPNLHNYTQQVLLDLSSALTCQLVGIDPSGPDPMTGEPKKCLAYDVTGKLGFVGPAPNGAPPGRGGVGGAVGMMGNLIGVLYTPPASSGDYFKYLADNFGIVKPVYAQGIGFKGLAPLLPVWTAFRNLAYLVFVIAFIVIGMAIMLRIKIDPRTVMTIQNQIPKLVIALLLVTFSYAIAGFLIDIMYVVIYLFFGITTGIQNLPPGTVDQIKNVQLTIQGNNPLGVFDSMVGFFDITSKASDSIRDLVIGLLDGSTWAGIAVVGGMFRGIIQGIPFLIIAIALLWALFRLWFQLIMAYVMILMGVIFAPLWMLVSILPGQGLGIGSWFRHMLAYISAFPTTIGMFLIGKVFIDTIGSKPDAFVPPLIGNPGGQNLLASLIGLGIILMTPAVVQMTIAAFKAPEFKYTAAIGQAVGVGPGMVGGTFGAIMQGLMLRAYTRDLFGGKGKVLPPAGEKQG